MFTINKPAVSKYKFTLDSTSNTGGTAQIATSGGHELVAIIVTAGTGAIVASIHDSANGVGDPKDTIWVGAEASNSFDWSPSQLVPMKKGIYIQIEQGGNPFNGKVTILYN